jgi:pimeloyl-ACP methyl ester carboxylesterase
VQEVVFDSVLLNEPVKLAYTEWGDSSNPEKLMCVHGLTRNSRDFDYLARELEQDFHLICPDIIGRGRSSWLNNKLGYSIPTYVNQIFLLMMKLGISRFHWLGTSMGGLIGMTLAAMPNSPIRSMIINDIGPFLPKESLARIRDALLFSDRIYLDKAALKFQVKTVYATFGKLTDEQWDHMTHHSGRLQDGGGYRMAYDPGIKAVFEAQALSDISLWEIWSNIHCPVLVIRGNESDLLLQETAEKMTTTGPKARLVEIPGVGHAPALMDTNQIAIVKNWLLAQQ